LNNKLIDQGRGKSKQEAEINAAKRALAKFEKIKSL
jgi:dsRNA-specific ribonuclease